MNDNLRVELIGLLEDLRNTADVARREDMFISSIVWRVDDAVTDLEKIIDKYSEQSCED